jgi:hypothetical protein
MTVRTIRPEELETFAGLGGTGWLANVVRSFWKDGQSSPDRCFAAEDQGRPVGRVFFHNQSSPTELAMFGTHLDWQSDFFEPGKMLLGTALARLKESGVTSVDYAIYDIYDPSPGRQQDLIEAVGFRQYQEKRRFVWKDPGTAVEVPARLAFRPLSEVGEDAFTRAVQRVTEGTLDREHRVRVRESGAQEAARRYMDVLKDADFQPTWWLSGLCPSCGATDTDLTCSGKARRCFNRVGSKTSWQRSIQRTRRSTLSWSGQGTVTTGRCGASVVT